MDSKNKTDTQEGNTGHGLLKEAHENMFVSWQDHLTPLGCSKLIIPGQLLQVLGSQLPPQLSKKWDEFTFIIKDPTGEEFEELPDVLSSLTPMQRMLLVGFLVSLFEQDSQEEI